MDEPLKILRSVLTLKEHDDKKIDRNERSVTFTAILIPVR